MLPLLQEHPSFFLLYSTESTSDRNTVTIISFERWLLISECLQTHCPAVRLLSHFPLSFLALQSALGHDLAIF